MTPNPCAERALFAQNTPPFDTNPTRAHAALEFGRFRVLLRQRQLVADGVPIEPCGLVATTGSEGTVILPPVTDARLPAGEVRRG
jgi:hypothetical protein